MMYSSTRDKSCRVTAAKAIAQGISAEGGLFVPEEFPKWDLERLSSLVGKSYQEKAKAILSDFLTANDRLFVRCGGHAKASGVTIRKKDYYRFATAFLSFCEKARLEHADNGEAREIPITVEDLNAENYSILERFEPFGEGFPAPVFALTCATEDIHRGQGRFEVLSGDGHGKAICFRDPATLGEGETTTFVGRMTRNVFQGRTTYTLLADLVRQD